LTAKKRLLASVAVLLIGAGLVTRLDSLVLLSIPVVTYLGLAMLVADEPHLVLRAGRGAVGGKVFEGGAAEIVAFVSNGGEGLGLLRVEDVLPSRLRLAQGSNVGFAPLTKGGRLELRYRVTSDTPGSYLVGPLLLTAKDSFGLSSKASRVDDSFRLDVLPRVHQLSRVPFRPRRTKTWPGQVVSPRAGTGQDFYALRQYLTGDPARRINWKATARTDKTYSNQYMSELGAEAVLVVDKSSASDFGVPPESALAYVERCAASISGGLLSRGNRVGMVIFGEEVRKVRPGTGRKQLERMLLTLVRTEKGSAETLELLPEYVTSSFPKAAQVVAVSSLADPRILAPLLRLGSRRDLRVVTPTLIEDGESGGQVDETRKLAVALVELNKSTIMERLGRRAVVAEWRVTGPIDMALETALLGRSVVVAR
jgi:uncharacterized protein (DUF58 family)